MDNFFEYLIAIFFIVSFLSSLLKPKGTNPTKAPDTLEQPRTKDQKIRSSARIKRPGQMEYRQPDYNTQTSAQRTSGNASRSSNDRSRKDYNFYDENKIYEEEKRNKLTEAMSVPENYSVPEIYSAGLDALKTLRIETPGVKENIRAKGLRDKIKDPSTLKDLIILSEILGKPKALRR